jgi:class 3 adenylate cyclase
MKVLFVDNQEREFERFRDLPFAQLVGVDQITHIKSPVNLSEIVANNPDLRLVVLDMLWDEEREDGGLPLGADAARELLKTNPELPVIIYSVMDNEARLRELIPEMIRIGAYDWVSKTESKIVRSFRFERAFNEGRDQLKRPDNRAILAKEQAIRHDIALAVMFVDMSGFTALTNEIGGARTVGLLKEFYKLVGDAVQRNHGYVDKYIGDAVMAVFGAIGSADDMAREWQENCVAAARSVQALAPAFKLNSVDPVLKKHFQQLTPEQLRYVGKIRIGLESGVVEIARFDRGNESEVTFVGTPVNIASRILAQAMPGEVWAGANLHTNALKAVDVAEAREVEYKNLPGKFQAYLLRT